MSILKEPLIFTRRSKDGKVQGLEPEHYTTEGFEALGPLVERWDWVIESARTTWPTSEFIPHLLDPAVAAKWVLQMDASNAKAHELLAKGTAPGNVAHDKDADFSALYLYHVLHLCDGLGLLTGAELSRTVFGFYRSFPHEPVSSGVAAIREMCMEDVGEINGEDLGAVAQRMRKGFQQETYFFSVADLVYRVSMLMVTLTFFHNYAVAETRAVELVNKVCKDGDA